MARFFDPDADGLNSQWQKSAGTAGWSLLDDAVRQPTAPVTGSDYISEITNNEKQDVHFASGSFAAGTWTLWVYCAGGTKRKIQYAIDTGGGFGALADLIAAGAVAAWVSVGVSTLITSQATLDAFQVRLQCVQTAGGGGATDVFVYAAYLEGPDAGATTTPIAATATLTLTPTVSKVATFARAASVALSLAPTVSRVATFSRAGETALTLSPAVAAVATYARAAAATLTLTPAVALARLSTIAATAGLTLGAAVALATVRALSATATLSLTASVAKTAKLAASATLSLTASVAKRAGLAVSVPLTLAPSVATVLIVLRSAAASLPLSASVSQRREYRILVTASLSLGATASHVFIAGAAAVAKVAYTVWSVHEYARRLVGRLAPPWLN